jgi:hypothetical protein
VILLLLALQVEVVHGLFRPRYLEAAVRSVVVQSTNNSRVVVVKLVFLLVIMDLVVQVVLPVVLQIGRMEVQAPLALLSSPSTLAVRRVS